MLKVSFKQKLVQKTEVYFNVVLRHFLNNHDRYMGFTLVDLLIYTGLSVVTDSRNR